MTIIRCPRCRDEVTAPAKASRLAIVRCPLCLEEYPLADALRHVPPELIVVGAAGEETPEHVEASATAAVPDYQVSGGAGVFDASPGAGAAMPVAPIKGVRTRRKQGSGIGSLIGIVFGGLAGISLAVLILWWVFKRDIGLGSTVAKIPYMQWIVPKEFRDDTGAPQGNGTSQSANVGPARNTAASAPGGAASRPRTGPATPSANSGGLSNTTEPGPFAGPGNAGPVAQAGGLSLDLPLDTAKAPAGNVDLSALDPNAPLIPLPGGNAAGTPKTPDLTTLIPASVPPAPAVAQAPPPTADDFKQAVLTAGDALVRYDASTEEGPDARKAKFTEMYVAIAEMGRASTFLSLSDSDVEGMVKEMQTQLNKLAGVGGPNKLSGVRFLAASHWTERKAGEGLLVAGHVKDFKAVGPQFEVTLDATTRGNALSIPLICDKNPQDFCQLEDELVVVGRIIDNPKANLPGYDGANPRILMLGYCVKAPKTQ